MTGLEIFEMYAGAEAAARELEATLTRRLQMMEGECEDEDAPARADGDASGVLLADYLSDTSALQAELTEAVDRRDNIRACCIYLSEQLPALLGEVMVRTYLDGLSVRACGQLMHYSVSQVKRLKKEAMTICRERMSVISWDGVHVPIVSLME